ncbi:MAG: CpsD/CapB family tyrosine-protein kinase [Deltaproteobacteria bacterium]|jgi:protein-tyrosine kinase
MSRLKKALEKAKEVRQSEDRDFIVDEEKSILPTRQRTIAKTECRPEVEICYSETKIKKIDDRVLKKGKVLSLFHDTEKIDQIKTLRTQVLNHFNQIGGNSILITSANPQEGKTFTAINLGVSIAQQLDHTVLLIDADLRKHNRYHKDFAMDFFGTDMTDGLSNYLLGQADIPDLLVNPGINRLVLMPAGRTLPNSPELLGSPRMARLVNDIKRRYADDRIIIFDSPSLLSCADPLVLTRYVDCILLVVEEERTTADDLQKATELLKDKPLFGTVLNKSKTKAH